MCVRVFIFFGSLQQFFDNFNFHLMYCLSPASVGVEPIRSCVASTKDSTCKFCSAEVFSVVKDHLRSSSRHLSYERLCTVKEYSLNVHNICNLLIYYLHYL